MVPAYSMGFYCNHRPKVNNKTTKNKYTTPKAGEGEVAKSFYICPATFVCFCQPFKTTSNEPENQETNAKKMTEPNPPLGCAILFIFALFYLIFCFLFFVCSPPARWGSLDFNFDKGAIPSSPHPSTPPLPALGAAGHVWTRTLFATKNARKHVRENVSIDARKHV